MHKLTPKFSIILDLLSCPPANTCFDDFGRDYAANFKHSLGQNQFTAKAFSWIAALESLGLEPWPTHRVDRLLLQDYGVQLLHLLQE